MRKWIVALFITVALVSCAGQRDADPRAEGTLCDPTDPLPSPAPSFPAARALIDTGEDSVLVNLEVAETSEQHQVGLMHRDSLPEDCGMVFLFFDEPLSAFWMKNTLIPLSIAFFDAEGKIVSILDMEPCEEDPCKLYHPGVDYNGALEVNQSMFEEWGVETGDEITVLRDE